MDRHKTPPGVALLCNKRKQEAQNKHTDINKQNTYSLKSHTEEEISLFIWKAHFYAKGNEWYLLFTAAQKPKNRAGSYAGI